VKFENQRIKAEMTIRLKDKSIKVEDKLSFIESRTARQYKNYADVFNTVQGLQNKELKRKLLTEVVKHEPDDLLVYLAGRLTKQTRNAMLKTTKPEDVAKYVKDIVEIIKLVRNSPKIEEKSSKIINQIRRLP